MVNFITGLDIGTAQIKGLIVERKKDGIFSVLSAFREPSFGLRRGIMADREDAFTGLNQLAAEMRLISKDALKNVFVNIQSEHIKVRISRGIAAVSQPDKEIREEDMERAIQASRATRMLPNYKMLHTIVREFLVDEIGDIQNPIGMTGSRLEVSTLIVESFAPHFDALTSVLSQAGIQVASVIFGPLASARAVLSKKQKELGVLMIDFGGGTTSIAVFDEAKPLYAKTFPVGSNHITNDIAIGMKLPIEAAEKIKIQNGTASARSVNRKEMITLSESPDSGEVSKRLLAETIEPRVAEILEIVHNELKPLKNRFQFPAGVVVTGAGVRLRGITEAVKEHLKLSVQVGIPELGRFDIDNAAHEELLRDPEFSTAVGLVLVGSDDVEKKSISATGLARRFLKNLIP